MDHSNSISRLWLGAAFVTALWLAHAPVAQANGAFAPSLNGEATAGLLLSTTAITFGVIDVLYLMHDRPMPIALSVLQIALAGVLVPAAAMTTNNMDIALYAGISMVWFTGHGIYNLIAYNDRQRDRERALAEQRAWHAACTREPEPHSLLCSRSR